MAVRHVTGHRLVAILEVLSPANKDRPQTVEEFAAKIVSALDLGIHALVVDLPPGPHDPQGVHGVIRRHLDLSDEPYDLPANEPLTLVSYQSADKIDAHLEHLAPGDALPDMPLFIRPDRYVTVPLESTYQAAYSGMPKFWRDVLEGKKA